MLIFALMVQKTMVSKTAVALSQIKAMTPNCTSFYHYVFDEAIKINKVLSFYP